MEEILMRFVISSFKHMFLFKAFCYKQNSVRRGPNLAKQTEVQQRASLLTWSTYDRRDQRRWVPTLQRSARVWYKRWATNLFCGGDSC